MTSTDLANRVLLEELGLKAISDITDNDETSQKCLSAYTSTKLALLQRHWWKWAERRAPLAVLSAVSVTGFEYSYTYPADCLAIRRIYNESDITQQIVYTTTTDSAKNLRYINTDTEDAILIYTANVDNVTLMSPLARDAIVIGMSAKLAMSLKKDKQASLIYKQEYEFAFNKAAATDSSEEYFEPVEYNELIDARN